MRSSEKPSTKQKFDQHPFLLSVDQVVRHLQTSLEVGLSCAQAQNVLRKHGPNKLDGEGSVRWYSVLLKQVSNAMILVRTHNLFFFACYGKAEEMCYLSPCMEFENWSTSWVDVLSDPPSSEGKVYCADIKYRCSS